MLFDSHIHSIHSPDGNDTIIEICEKAIERGLNGIAITDHCETQNYEKLHFENRLKDSSRAIDEAIEKYKDKLIISKGIEIGQMLFEPSYAQKAMKLADFDFVLGSVHKVRNMRSISSIDFSSLSEKEGNQIIRTYYEELFETVKKMDFDILSHLTYPLRYTNGIQKQNYTIETAMDIVENLLCYIIKSDKGIELNLSGLNTPWNKTMPDQPLLKLYKQLGGSIITVGSDAHTASNVGSHISYAYQLLKECGFNQIAFYLNRQPAFYEI